jgi:hypothetical protein
MKQIAKYGQNPVSFLQGLYWPVGGPNFWMPYLIGSLDFAMTLPDQYLNIFIMD